MKIKGHYGLLSGIYFVNIELQNAHLFIMFGNVTPKCFFLFEIIVSISCRIGARKFVYQALTIGFEWATQKRGLVSVQYTFLKYSYHIRMIPDMI